jgi:asparagine synthase (glutamine-hydrolysing)
MVSITCIIFGAYGKLGKDVSKPVLKMLESIILDFPSATNVFLHLQNVILKLNLPEKLGRTQLSQSTIASGMVSLRSSDEDCIYVEESTSSSVSLLGRIFNLPDTPRSIIESYVRISNSSRNSMESSKLFLESLDGQYAFALRRGGTLLLARDPVGVKPLYIAENDEFVAFSSRCRPLWQIGMRDCKILSQPILVHSGKAERVNIGVRLESQVMQQPKLVDSFITHLSDTIKKIASSSGNKLAVLFSGGLDSSIIAKLSKDLAIQPTLFCAGASSSRDMTNARRMSAALDLPLIEREITFDDVTNCLTSLIRTTESAGMIPVSTSLPFHFALEQCADRGLKTVLHGQGADELFCGYERYEKTLSAKGYTALCTEMLNDVVGLGEAIPLYDKIGAAKGIELFAPYADISVVKFSLEVPIELKLFKKASGYSRKYFLNQIANKIGVPTQLLPKQKVAAQFGSGAAGILDKAARKAGFTKGIAKRMGFPLPVQAYLREIALSLGLP